MRARFFTALCVLTFTCTLPGEPIFESGFESPPVLHFTAVSGSDQIALPLTTLTESLVVSIVDDFGSPVEGHFISFEVTSGAGSQGGDSYPHLPVKKGSEPFLCRATLTLLVRNTGNL